MCLPKSNCRLAGNPETSSFLDPKAFFRTELKEYELNGNKRCWMSELACQRQLASERAYLGMPMLGGSSGRQMVAVRNKVLAGPDVLAIMA